MRILIVEDDPRVAEQAQRTLVAAGFVVDLAHDGEEGHFLGDTEPYDAVVLDLGLPMLDGLSVLQRWRQAGRTMPVLILTARGTWREKVMGLRAGAASPARLEEMSLEDVECLLIKKALARFDGNVSRAAEALGLSRSALYRRLQRYGL